MEWLTAFTHDLQLSAPALWHGLSITLKVVCIATIGGIFIGTLLALMRLSSIRDLEFNCPRLCQFIPLDSTPIGIDVVLLCCTVHLHHSHGKLPDH